MTSNREYKKPFRWPDLWPCDPGVIRCGWCLRDADLAGLGFDAVSPVIALRGWDEIDLECPDCGREWILKRGQMLFVQADLVWQNQGQGVTDDARATRETVPENRPGNDRSGGSACRLSDNVW